MRNYVLLGVLVPAWLVSGQANLPAAEAAAKTLWEIGKVDHDTADLALGPGGFADFAKSFPRDALFVVGRSEAKKDWPYAHPGPGDAWAGNRPHTFTVVFAVAGPGRGMCTLRVVLNDMHNLAPPRLRVQVNGHNFDRELPKGASPDSISGQPAKGRQHRVEIAFPAAWFQPGNNSITLTALAGSWMLYDGLSLEVPSEVTAVAVASGVSIISVQPTPLFPKVAGGEPLHQIVRLMLCNIGPPVALRAKAIVPGHEEVCEDLGQIESGASVQTIRVPDLTQPAEIRFELHQPGKERPVARWNATLQPQRKWKLYCVAYSHHDLGFGNYPHRLRTDIRHGNIERPLKFCTETDAWDDDSKFRFVIETSEPITSFLGSHSDADAAELARRLREGRIQIGALHNTANTEQLSYELMARLFYLANRHSRDLLGAPKGRTAQIDDVIGLTWPLATFCPEADVPYFFHGPNLCGRCFGPAADEPVFYWQGPSPGCRVLVRSAFYGGYAGDNPGDLSEGRVQDIIEQLGARWPYDALFLQEGTDFQLVTMDTASRIHAWNARWAYPRLVCATMDMFFDDITRQAQAGQIKVFAGDGNNQWADQDSTDAWLLALARRQGEAIPTAEKFATIATALAGGGYPWTDIYQAYHRLLLYHEHTDAAAGLGRDREAAQYYETELEEDREMVVEAKEFADAAWQSAQAKLAGLISTHADKNVAVFNPLGQTRTDVVRLPATDLGPGTRLVDAVTGKEVPHQVMPDGSVAFIATEVPATGYKTLAVLAGGPTSPRESPPAAVLENAFYRLAFDPASGAIGSIFDKQLGVELVDASAPHKFNEYLYERFETPRFEDGTTWHRLRKADLSVAQGPVAQVLTIAGTAPGVEGLRQSVVLYHDINRIDFALDLVKSPSGRTQESEGATGKESVYVALPWAVPKFQIRHELPGATVEPIRQQFSGSCTAYYAIRHFADISNSRYGVTVSCPESALVEYGRPRSCPIPPGRESDFERTLEYPANSRMYLYLMNNMFDVNIRWDQRGPARFSWSVRSHAGDWRQGKADQFGWEVLNPLAGLIVAGKKDGPLPAAYSFLTIDRPNVVSTTIKPAEANGAGIILRFSETQGQETTAVVSLPFMGKITSAVETNLVEEDRPVPLEVKADNQVMFTIRPFGVKTIRVVSAPRTAVPAVAGLKAAPVSDMQVDLTWQSFAPAAADISHYHVYRGTAPDFQPNLLRLVARPAQTSHRDGPKLHYGGWINNRLDPGTTYYYKVTAVDRWNNEGPPSPAVAATTRKTAEKNMRPLRVECLRAVLVSPLSKDNFVNLLFRTNCEADVVRYEIHRSAQPGFTPDDSTRVGVVEAAALIKGSAGYGRVPVDRRMADYDHLMYQDDTVAPATTYFYRVCAVDSAGQKGPFSLEAAVRTK